ncbi:MAG: Methyltransferase type 11 [Candidatus Sulfotelmatobacter sp.]|nr:Methyltransferase type 11 [Candidatus Sulfotelmatobacter sp.]
MDCRGDRNTHRLRPLERFNLTVNAVLTVAPASARTVLVAGSGPDRMGEWPANGFTATYLDIEQRNNPDIVADMTDMGEIGSFDVVYCCHALEHLYPHQVHPALCEFRRVLNPGGMAIIMVPDLEDVRPTNDVLDYPEAGPITGLHLYYGDHSKIAEFPYMAHHCGFVAKTLQYALKSAEFDAVITERTNQFNLMGIGFKR